MKLVLFSDLHTEFWPDLSALNPFMDYDVPICVLAGDIASGRHNVKKVLEKFATMYEHVIYVPGNHEYYGTTIEKFNDFLEVSNNIHILNPGCVRVGDVQFIGAPLWTNFRNDPFAELAAKDMITDFRLIKKFSPQRAKDLYEYQEQFIRNMYENTNAPKKVIVTHFLPAVECVHPRFGSYNLLNKYFANDLGGWIEALKDTTWLFGHTHDPMDFMLGDTRLICNPLGYPNEFNDDYKGKIIEIL